MINTIIQGDCLKVMKTFDDECIDLTVTSPPYDNLRTYNGYTFDFEGIAKELYRVTKQGGVVVWVVGDQTINGSETGTSFKQALYFKEIGFNLHDTMIWRKTNPMPQTKIGRRYTLAMEYMFIFTKGYPKTFNPLMEKTKTFGKELSPSTQRRPDGTKSQTRLNAQIGKKINEYKQYSNVWDISTKTYSGHPATFPEKLAEDHILSWSNEGDIILDPMAGSGTTLKMAKKNNRNYIGIEIAPEYIDIINQRLNKE
jgi:site-specific DNA-methyltransferase (adenine-specific)